MQLLTWVGDHHQDAVGAVLDNVRDDELEDVDVALNQVETALALLLASSGRHHHHLGISGDAVVCKTDRFSDLAAAKHLPTSAMGHNTKRKVLPLSATILCVLRKRDPCWRSMTSPFSLSSITSIRASSSHKS